MTEARKGWGWPALSRKAHYFIYDKSMASLCLKWAYAGPLHDDNHNSPDNCKQCARLREKMHNAKDRTDTQRRIRKLERVAKAAMKLLQPPYRRGAGLMDPEERSDWHALRDRLIEAGYEWEEWT